MKYKSVAGWGSSLACPELAHCLRYFLSRIFITLICSQSQHSHLDSHWHSCRCLWTRFKILRFLYLMEAERRHTQVSLAGFSWLAWKAKMQNSKRRGSDWYRVDTWWHVIFGPMTPWVVHLSTESCSSLHSWIRTIFLCLSTCAPPSDDESSNNLRWLSCHWYGWWRDFPSLCELRGSWHPSLDSASILVFDQYFPGFLFVCLFFFPIISTTHNGADVFSTQTTSRPWRSSRCWILALVVWYVRQSHFSFVRWGFMGRWVEKARSPTLVFTPDD